MINKEQLDIHKNEMLGKISEMNPLVLGDFPVENYLSKITSYPEFFDYSYLCSKLKKVFKQIKKRFGSDALRLYHRLALSSLLSDSVEAIKTKNFPEDILNLYREWYERILEDLSTQPSQYYDHENDEFLKDLAICSFRAIPVGGAWIIAISQTTEKPFFFDRLRRGWNCVKTILLKFSFFEYLLSFSTKVGVHKAYYEIHTVDRYLPRFTPGELLKAYVRISEMLKLKPSIKGLYRCSWFLDPKMEHLSPHLTFLRKIPEQNGAAVFRVGVYESDIRRSISMSAERRRHYEEGKYIPTRYAYIWPREKLIEWADKKGHSG